MLLAYQSLSIAPLYIFKSTFAEDIMHLETVEEIFGVLSFVFWTLTLVPLLKYVFVVLRADDNGEVSGLKLSMYKGRHECALLLICLAASLQFFFWFWDFDEPYGAWFPLDGIDLRSTCSGYSQCNQGTSEPQCFALGFESGLSPSSLLLVILGLD